jgi:signal peptidase II
MEYNARSRLFSLAAGIFALDQFTKWLVVRNIPLYGEVPVIPTFFSISHHLNPGAAFSLFANTPRPATTALAIFSAVVMTLILVLLARAHTITQQGVAMALVLGGAAGNFLDRVRLKAVVDFLAFDFGSYHWPDFNVADSAIVIGAVLLALDALFAKQK